MSIDIKRLAELAKLRIEGNNLAVMEQDMASIIALMDTLKDVPLSQGETPGNQLSMLNLREDVVGESLPVNLLTEQTPEGDFSIPKVVE